MDPKEEHWKNIEDILKSLREDPENSPEEVY